MARAGGETAPLLFTSLGNNTWSTDLSRPMSSLPVTIYAFAGSPFEDWIALAWATWRVGMVLLWPAAGMILT